MNDLWVVELRRLSELVLAASAMGAVVLLVLEAVYLVIFTCSSRGARVSAGSGRERTRPQISP